jgi:hypothetical protein
MREMFEPAGQAQFLFVASGDFKEAQERWFGHFEEGNMGGRRNPEGRKTPVTTGLIRRNPRPSLKGKMRTGGATSLFNTEPNEERPVLKYDNIVVAPRGIAETYGRKLCVFVPAGEINQITLKYGKSDHRPIVSMAIGGVLALIGVAGVILFFISAAGFRYEVGMVFFGIIGGSIIFDTLKERYFLEVEGSKGLNRLVLSKNAKRSDIDEFCNKVRTIYKYQITDDVRDDT